MVSVTEGAPILTVGGVLSTLKVLLGPAPVSVLPTLSEEVPAAIEIPMVPSPVIELIVMVGLFVVPLDTPIEPDASPLVSRVTSPEVRFTLSAPE